MSYHRPFLKVVKMSMSKKSMVLLVEEKRSPRAEELLQATKSLP